jgi:hypothetical protein
LIGTWIEQPYDACKEIGANRYFELFVRGVYEGLEKMIWYLKSGALIPFDCT